jgi:hypothetical protein
MGAEGDPDRSMQKIGSKIIVPNSKGFGEQKFAILVTAKD